MSLSHYLRLTNMSNIWEKLFFHVYGLTNVIKIVDKSLFMCYNINHSDFKPLIIALKYINCWRLIAMVKDLVNITEEDIELSVKRSVEPCNIKIMYLQNSGTDEYQWQPENILKWVDEDMDE